MILLIVLGYMVLSLLGLLLFFILCLLFVPFRYKSWGQANEDQKGVLARVDWLMGLLCINYSFDAGTGQKLELRILHFIRKDIGLGSSKKMKLEGKEDDKPQEEKKNKETGRKIFRLTRDKLRLMIKGALNVLSAYKPYYFSVECIVGFEDSYHTGLLLAGVQSFYPVLRKMGEIRFTPDFEEETLEGHYALSGRIFLVIAAFEALKLYFSKTFRKS